MVKNFVDKCDALADTILAEFGLDLMIDRLVVWQMPLSRSTTADVFFNHKNQLFVYISSPARQTLGDVKKLLFRTGLTAYDFLPPAGRPNYFTDIAIEHFNKTYPSKPVSSEADLLYFKTLAPYNPALIQVKTVRDGHIYGFDPDAKGSWRVFAKLSYSRLDKVVID